MKSLNYLFAWGFPPCFECVPKTYKQNKLTRETGLSRRYFYTVGASLSSFQNVNCLCQRSKFLKGKKLRWNEQSWMMRAGGRGASAVRLYSSRHVPGGPRNNTFQQPRAPELLLIAGSARTRVHRTYLRLLLSIVDAHILG